MLFLKECNVSDCLISGLSFDHNTGPRYLILSLPKFTVLNLGIEKSTFLRAYPEVFILKRSLMYFVMLMYFNLTIIGVLDSNVTVMIHKMMQCACADFLY